MFNEVRMMDGFPVRVWARDPRGGRYVIFPDGLMRLYPDAELAALERAVGAEIAHAFPAQDNLPNNM